MKQKLELLNNLGCHYIINNVISQSTIVKKVSADLFINTIPYTVEIDFTFNGTGYVHTNDPAVIAAIEELLKNNTSKVAKFKRQKTIIFILELIIFVECVRNIYLTVGHQLQTMQFSIPGTVIAFVCIAILLGMFRINLIAKHH